MGLVSPDRYAEYASTEREVPVTDLLAHYTDVDVVIVEGYKTAGLPSIVVTRSGVDRLRGKDSFDLVDGNTIAIACNDVVARDFRTRADKKAESVAGGDSADTGAAPELPPFLDINDAAGIANFIYDRIQGMK